MKRHLSYIIIIIAAFSFLPLHIMADNTNTTSNKEEQLKRKLRQKLTPQQRLNTLFELVKCYRDEPDERDYSKLLYEQAVKLDSIDKIEQAIFTLTRYYYNKNKADSVEYWSEKVKKLENKNKLHSDTYFRICSMSCQYTLWTKPNEISANEAMRLYHLALKEKNPIGIYTSCETLGVAYSSMDQDSIAVKYYIEGIKKLKNVAKSNLSNIHSLLELTIASMLHIHSVKGTEDYITQYENITEKIKYDKYLKNNYPFGRCQWLATCFRLEFYTYTSNFKKAQYYLNKATKYNNNIDDIYARYSYYLASTHYYKATQKYNLALLNINETMTMGDSYNLYVLKGEILSLLNRDKEAAECYKLALNYKKNENTESFMRQMNQLSHMQDLNNATQAQNEEALKRKQWQIIVILCVTLFTGILLVLSLFNSAKNRRTKMMLQSERDKLVDSEKSLKEAKEKAEQADRLKSYFLANMSHEIRTPLNAIVGFSQVLCDPQSNITDTDRNQFSNLILHNSDLLLNLINDILDISKLEANMYKFDFADSDIELCCSDCIESVRHIIKPEVTLTFIKHDTPLILNTDILRLRQVIMNLLTNASKFTDKGSITLDYKTDIDKGIVEFSVTDTGCGIPDDKSEVIFQRFEKLNSYVQGTGLGLAISALIVKQFGGEIWVDKTYTSGARFIFTHRM